MDARDRFVGYLVVQFVVVVVLRWAVARLLGARSPNALWYSTVADVGITALDATLLVAFVGYLCAVVGIAGYGRHLENRYRYWVALAYTVPGFVVLFLAVVWFNAIFPPLGIGILLTGGPSLAVAVGALLGWFGPGNAVSLPGRPATRLVVVAVCLGVLAGGVAATGGVDSVVEHDRRPINPTASFEFSYEPVNKTHGILTVTHSGGDPVRQDRLYVAGTGFAAVDGVDRSESGPWTGEASLNRSGTDSVRVGDELTVGATADCEVRVVLRQEDVEVGLVFPRTRLYSGTTTLASGTCDGASGD